MRFQGPASDDLVNIEALNLAFLKVATTSELQGYDAIFRHRMTASQLARLSSMPFLLFSFRETDPDYWQRVLADDPQIDLIATPLRPTNEVRALQAAALGFLWQLSRRNPYVTRLVSGAPPHWCEELAATTLVNLLQKAADRADLIAPRFEERDKAWRRLLRGGASSRRHLQLMSQQSAMQALLTRSQPTHNDRIAAAACDIQAPHAQVAEQRAGELHDTKV